MRYAIGGSFASAAWGQVRFTHDIDIVLQLDEDSAAAIALFAADRFFFDAAEVLEVLDPRDPRRAFQPLHKASKFRVDCFVPLNDPMLEEAFARARQIEVLTGIKAYCSCAEEIVVQKLRLYDLANRTSDRQWNDVMGVLEVRQGDLDLDYMERRAKGLKVEDLLAQALRQVAR